MMLASAHQENPGVLAHYTVISSILTCRAIPIDIKSPIEGQHSQFRCQISVNIQHCFTGYSPTPHYLL
jgi:hypothetical protein